MHIYIDTEFTNLLNSDLISLALVCGKDYLYVVSSDFDRENCSAFTRKFVLPHLGNAAPMSRAQMQGAVRAWLQKYADQQPVLCFDNSVDIKLLEQLLGSIPPWLAMLDIKNKLESGKLDNYYLYNYAIRHHALHDALANQHAHGLVC